MCTYSEECKLYDKPCDNINNMMAAPKCFKHKSEATEAQQGGVSNSSDLLCRLKVIEDIANSECVGDDICNCDDFGRCKRCIAANFLNNLSAELSGIEKEMQEA